ncbi:hypothetical protein I3J27_12665 [Bradyrhizobium xenonodulans]|uniref:Uncharacterized protein n=1 Tax=Bradyrhizobium xenonodulans TaxID=2736875 RepID=A0ABY7MS58_9BRAD|nr:hypothetical protein [Bradyrhizobium xenonodulans]WBL81225.1 hypothetical protein I3J27_12665 [Bradyrhizobium xenonodulans]
MDFAHRKTFETNLKQRFKNQPLRTDFSGPTPQPGRKILQRHNALRIVTEQTKLETATLWPGQQYGIGLPKAANEHS